MYDISSWKIFWTLLFGFTLPVFTCVRWSSSCEFSLLCWSSKRGWCNLPVCLELQLGARHLCCQARREEALPLQADLSRGALYRWVCERRRKLDGLVCKCTLKPLPPNVMSAAEGETPVADGAPPPGVLYSFGTPWPELNQGLSYRDTFRCAGFSSLSFSLVCGLVLVLITTLASRCGRRHHLDWVLRH